MTAGNDFNFAGKTSTQLGQELLVELGKGYWASNDDRVAALINAGADLEQKDGQGNTPLLLAAAEGLTKSGLALVAANANVNAQNTKGYTALHLSLSEGDFERAPDDYLQIAKAVLAKKPNVKLVNDLNQTVLHISAGRGLYYFTQDILALNPPLRTKDSFNHRTALQAAKAAPYGEATVKLIQKAYVKKVLLG